MYRTGFAVLALLSLTALPGCSGPLSPERPHMVRASIEDAIERRGFIGAALVDHQGELIVRTARSSHDDWTNTPDTRFYIASISKQFCAVMVLQLVDEGLLRLDDRVDAYLPGLSTDQLRDVRILDLLNHRAGLPEFYEGEGVDPLAIFNSDLAIGDVVQLIDRHPGTARGTAAYADTHFVLLAAIIESVTGSAYADVLERRILGPLDLQDTGVFSGDGDHAAPLFQSPAPDAGPSIFVNRRLGYGAGDLFSTLDDLRVFADALYRGDLLSQPMRELMLQPHTSMGGPYGLAVWIENPASPAAADTIYHHGGGPSAGVNTMLAWRPADDSIVILLSNVHTVAPRPIAMEIFTLID